MVPRQHGANGGRVPAASRVVARTKTDDGCGQQRTRIAGPAQHGASNFAGEQRRNVVEYFLERGGLDEQSLDRRGFYAPWCRFDGEVAVVIGQAAGGGLAAGVSTIP